MSTPWVPLEYALSTHHNAHTRARGPRPRVSAADTRQTGRCNVYNAARCTTPSAPATLAGQACEVQVRTLSMVGGDVQRVILPDAALLDLQ